MEIDQPKLKKCFNVPPDTKALIDKLITCSDIQLSEELPNVKIWNYSKCELSHWMKLLNRFDYILELSCKNSKVNQWCLPCDNPGFSKEKEILLEVLKFTVFLINNTSRRNVYNSVEHLISLLSSSDMEIVCAVLDLLHTLSKKTNCLSKLSDEKSQALFSHLVHLAESWGGKEYGFGLGECCQDLPITAYPPSASTLHFEFYSENAEESDKKKSKSVIAIHVDNINKIDKTPAQIMQELVEKYAVPENKQMQLLNHVRLVHSFSDYYKRILCVQARLQALSILVYSNKMPKDVKSIIYDDLIEELVDVLQLEDNRLIELKAVVLKTLSSIMHFDENLKLSAIIFDKTGISSYYGFLPELIRKSFQFLKGFDSSRLFPFPFVKALVSVLYYFTKSKNGGDCLIVSGIIDTLLEIIDWNYTDNEHIILITRSVKIIHFISELDVQAFNAIGCVDRIIKRLEMEVNICKEEQPYVINPILYSKSDDSQNLEPSRPISTSMAAEDAMEVDSSSPNSSRPTAEDKSEFEAADSHNTKYENISKHDEPKEDLKCFPERANLVKALLNFLLSVIEDSIYSDNVRQLMIDSSLLQSLKHIVSNAEYYGPSLFILAIEIVTVYINQEPTVLPALLENGIIDIINYSLLVKKIPASRDVLAILPNVFGAISLNTHGLQSFAARKPFEKIFKVFISPEYLKAFRSKRKFPEDTASNFGEAVAQLLRHEPSLKQETMAAIIKLLEELCVMGKDPQYVCSRLTAKPEIEAHSTTKMKNVPNESGSSSDEDVDEFVDFSVTPAQGSSTSDTTYIKESSRNKTAVPLVEYIHNTMCFLDGLLNKNGTHDLCREFIHQKGLLPLINMLSLPNYPVDFPLSPTCLSVSNVCKSILTFAPESQVLKQGLLLLKEECKPFYLLQEQKNWLCGSMFMKEAIDTSNNEIFIDKKSLTVLNSMAAVHACIVMFTLICRANQSNIRTISVSHWGSALGVSVLKLLSSLYMSLIWENIILTAMCSREIGQFIHSIYQEKKKKFNKDIKDDHAQECGSSGAISAKTINSSLAMEVDDQNSTISRGNHKPKIKFSLKAVEESLTKFFGILIKLCVGSPVRQRQGQQTPPSSRAPSPAAHAIVSTLSDLISTGLSWSPPPSCPRRDSFRLSFCCNFIRTILTMLMDEKRYLYHLMLQKFVSCGGLDAFFNAFDWALTDDKIMNVENGLENSQLPDGTFEFLKAWLSLLEKLINPDNVLKSPHSLFSNDEHPSFNPVCFLIHIHKQAFKRIKYLWLKKSLIAHSGRIADFVLPIISHLLESEAIFKEKLSKSEGIQKTSSQCLTAGDADINQDHLTQLTEMGFSRSLATEALLNTNSLEQATNYLLSRPSISGHASENAWSIAMELSGMSDADDEMQRAIAISVGENVHGSTSQDDKEPGEIQEQKEIEEQEEPLSTEIISEFTTQIVTGCIDLIYALPDIVYQCCDVLICVARRNGEEWKNKHLIGILLAELHSQANNILNRLKSNEASLANKCHFETEKPSNVESNFAALLHLFSLIFEEMKIPCAAQISQSGLMPVFIEMLDIVYQQRDSCPDEPPTKWISFLVLLIDLYEKAALISERKAPLLKVPNRQWKWFDKRNGKWINYTLLNNKLIDDAYKVGKNCLRISENRTSYTISFRNMIQINEETRRERPVIFTVEDKEKKEKGTLSKDDEKSKSSRQLTEETTKENSPSSENIKNSEMNNAIIEPVQIDTVKCLTPEQCEKLVRICVSLLKVPLEPDALHAIMRLCLRLTRKHSNAILFCDLNGPKILLSLTEPHAFEGFYCLTALLLRHILEDPVALKASMNEVLRWFCNKDPAYVLATNEIHYTLRELSPAACRNSEIFTSVASDILRLVDMPQSKKDKDENKLKASVQIVKACPSKSQISETSGESEVANKLIYELLNGLIAEPIEITDEVKISEDTSNSPSASDLQPFSSDMNNTDHIPPDDDDCIVISLTLPDDHGSNNITESFDSQKQKRFSKDSSKENKEPCANAPIIKKSGICNLLAEMVRSYPECARLISEYTFHAGDSKLVSEDCSALTFILDNLAHSNQTAGDNKCPDIVASLITAIASCNYPEVQTTLVQEVRLALHRALFLPESYEKHNRIQALTKLISQMIGCSSSRYENQFARCTLRSQMPINNIVKILLKKGIVQDLARIPHYLDLCSPYMVATVNSALKPLESLSRLANLPSSNKKSKSKIKTISTTEGEGILEIEEEDISNVELNSGVTAVVQGENQVSDTGLNSTIETQEADSFIFTDSEDIENAVEMEEAPSIQIRRHSSFDDSTHDDHEESIEFASISESVHSHSGDDDEQHWRIVDDNVVDDTDEDDDDSEEDDDDTSSNDENDLFPTFEGVIYDEEQNNLFSDLGPSDYHSSGSPVNRTRSGHVQSFQVPAIVGVHSSENPALDIHNSSTSLPASHPLLHLRLCRDFQCSLHTRDRHHQRASRPSIGNQRRHASGNSNNSSNRNVNLQRIIHRLLNENSDEVPRLLPPNFTSQPARSRVVIVNGGMSIMSTTEEVFDLRDQILDPLPRNTGVSSVNQTFSRWQEESKVLDGDSIYDCSIGLMPKIIKCLETRRDKEISEAKKKKHQDIKDETTTDENTEKSSDVALTANEEGISTSSEKDHTYSTVIVPEPQQTENIESSGQSLPTVTMPDDTAQGMEIPDGVDPSFLAALPDNIRQEVIEEQLRLQRLRQSSSNVPGDNSNNESSFTEVSPEFLAALPENIQEEVLMQQRAEQLRLSAQNSNPDTPVDPTNFIQTLPSTLRQQILSDMDDSLLQLLSPEMAAEAHSLRREREARHRQTEGLFLSQLLHSEIAGGERYIIHTGRLRSQWSWNDLNPRATTILSANASGSNESIHSKSMKLRGYFLLDHEALACLLVLLFLDEPQLDSSRLHRILRNVCHHEPTRNWVIKSLLSILERTKGYLMPDNKRDSYPHKKVPKVFDSRDEDTYSSPRRKSQSNRNNQLSWLSVSFDAALGCKTNVFQIRHLATTRHQKNLQSVGPQRFIPSVPFVTIHPLASPVIFQNVFDALLSLAKNFPAFFLPGMNKGNKNTVLNGKEQDSLPSTSDYKVEERTLSSKSESSVMSSESDFWGVLMKLDSLRTTTRRGKAILRKHRSGSFSVLNTSDKELKPVEFETSPLAHLIGLLSHSAVRKSSALTDRLLQLLEIIVLAFPMNENYLKCASSDINEQPEADKETRSTCMFPFHDERDESMFRNETINSTIMLQPAELDKNFPVKGYLELLVEVLMTKTCSEEGLRCATAFLSNISRACFKARCSVLRLLLESARHLGSVVCCNILALMNELRYNPVDDRSIKTYNKKTEYDEKLPIKGTIQDRYNSRAIILSAPAKMKGKCGRELQLPTMHILNSKTSNQALFLRVLKVLREFNEPIKSSAPNKPQENNPSNCNSTENSIADSVSSENMPVAMDTTESGKTAETKPTEQVSGCLHLSKELKLEKLWDTLSECLCALSDLSDHHSVLVLQPAVEAFFLVHASEGERKQSVREESRESEIAHIQDMQPSTSFLNQSDYSLVSDSHPSSSLPSDTIKFLKFAETHRTVLNQILRQSTIPLSKSPFSVLVDHTRILDFDVKQRYFRQELQQMDERSGHNDFNVRVRREHVFEDSYRELHRRSPEEWKSRFYIVFEGEEGQDAGGLLREWYTIIAREIFNPMYALFTTSPGDRVTYMINPSSHCNSNHLSYFKFVGHVIAKAVYDNKLLESYFTRSFYKHILGKCVKYTDMESEDYSFYQGLVFLLEHDVKELGYELTFSVEVQEFGVTDIRDLKPNGRNIQVTEENKHEYVKLVCQEKMTGAIRQQLKAFLEGFYEIIPKRLISIFDEQELELLISGLPNIDITDLKANTEYHKYQQNSLQIQWFWRALKSFDQADRAKFLQFVTGTSKVPLQGFSALEGMNGVQKFQIERDNRSTDRLPSAHTCFNQLVLPAYETYDKLRTMLLKAINECSEGFGFA